MCALNPNLAIETEIFASEEATSSRPQETTGNDPFVILLAPNACERMGGEAIKALQIWLALERIGVKTHQITHERVKKELEAKYPHANVTYVKETWLNKFLYFICCHKQFVIEAMFMWNAGKIARKMLKEHPGAVVHITAPVSPILPSFRIPGARVVIGPLNGNIYYPPAFQNRESFFDRVRRLSHRWMQYAHGLFFRGKQTADALLISGGERTYQSLRWAGCRDEQFVDSLDSGILDRLGQMPLAQHSGRNMRFVHNGRLVDHKGTDLAIRALAKTKNPVTLEIIGRGPMLPRLHQITEELGLKDRVIFTDWFEDHSKVAQTLQQFRGFVFPSLAEANGIVVQEAMMLGLPTIALDWGGPSLLITPECGFLIKPTDEETVTTQIAQAMDRLAEDGELAQRMAQAGRNIATKRGFLWEDLIHQWMPLYRKLAAQKA
jgi:glycosyltransferase involved in cell wall biosynthesis